MLERSAGLARGSKKPRSLRAYVYVCVYIYIYMYICIYIYREREIDR